MTLSVVLLTKGAGCSEKGPDTLGEPSAALLNAAKSLRAKSGGCCRQKLVGLELDGPS